jgi:GMP synthase (glutamine-hydrolysing)
MRVLFVQQQDDCPPALVGERLAELGAQIEVVEARTKRFPDPARFDLVVPLGSEDSAADDRLPYLRAEWELLDRAVAADVPVFGICFGAQLLCRVLGGVVREAAGGPEIGWLPIETDAPELVESGPWLSWHVDVMELGAGSVEIARSPAGPQAFAHGRHLGVQFHPEVTTDILRSWAANDGGSLAGLGIEPTELFAESETMADANRERAGRLVDRLLVRDRGSRGRAPGGPSRTSGSPQAR